jgi:hypothetical protein
MDFGSQDLNHDVDLFLPNRISLDRLVVLQSATLLKITAPFDSKKKMDHKHI